MSADTHRHPPPPGTGLEGVSEARSYGGQHPNAPLRAARQNNAPYPLQGGALAAPTHCGALASSYDGRPTRPQHRPASHTLRSPMGGARLTLAPPTLAGRCPALASVACAPLASLRRSLDARAGERRRSLDARAGERRRSLDARADENKIFFYSNF